MAFAWRGLDYLLVLDWSLLLVALRLKLKLEPFGIILVAVKKETGHPSTGSWVLPERYVNEQRVKDSRGVGCCLLLLFLLLLLLLLLLLISVTMIEDVPSTTTTTTTSAGPRHSQHSRSSMGTAEGVLRQAPPSAFTPYSYQTPSSQRSTRSLPPYDYYHHHDHHQQHHQQQPHAMSNDSPFLSPPPTAAPTVGTSHSARASRTRTRIFAMDDSPFQSPPPTSRSVGTGRPKVQPLILDPNAAAATSHRSYSQQGTTTSTTTTPSSSWSSRNHPPTPQNMAQQFLQVATGRIRDQLASPHPQYSNALSGMGMAMGMGMGVHTTPLVSHSCGNANGGGLYDSQDTRVITAAHLARRAPQAGYLQKLGHNIATFKRRFFVLQTETNLYYYLSPNDMEPRGKVALLEGTQIEPLEELPDGRYRFQIKLPTNDTNDNGENTKEHFSTSTYTSTPPSHTTIVLEARNQQMGQEWIQKLQEERVPALKQQIDALQSQVQSQTFQMEALQQQVEHYKLVEKDRDGALEDARQWKEQFQKLDDALRLLTQRMRKHPTCSGAEKSRRTRNDEDPVVVAEEKKEMDTTDSAVPVEDHYGDGTDVEEEEAAHNSTDETPTKNNQSKSKTPNPNQPLPSSLLDTAFQAVGDNEDTLEEETIEEIMSVPGTYFSGLANACQQQRDALRLAAEEAAMAVEDVQDAQAQVEDMKQRMVRAEKHLTKLWEENCTIRKALKQKKREKRVLVREYKALQHTNQELKGEKAAAVAVATARSLSTRRSPSLTVGGGGAAAAAAGSGSGVGGNGKENEHENARPLEDTMLGSDEERLIDELEEHVVSSIQLHERLMRVREFPLDSESETEMNTSLDNSEAAEQVGVPVLATATETETIKETLAEQPLSRSAQISPRLASLMDEEDSEASSEEEEDFSVNEYQSMSPSVVSSVGAEFGSVAEFSHFSGPSVPNADSIDSTPERPNPVLRLDRHDDDEKQEELDEYDRQPALCSASTQSQSTAASKSVITDNGQATARLSCPLADVVQPKGHYWTPMQASVDKMSVYHLTFYSRKIGIQFQKAPPAPVKPKGILTAALTADLNGETHGSDKTAAELRNVAAITSLASGRNAKNEEVCPIALPKDAVLVCGFHGFDESGMNPKPKLGARLVAFDGVSVEIGPWTFDSIRKAIQARGRPLTLSFRNDFLTTEQRAVLTKAVMEVDAKCPPPRPTVQFGVRPPSTTPSVTSALSHDTECFVNDEEVEGKPSEFRAPENDLSTWVQEKNNCCHSKLSAASHSVSDRLRHGLSSSSHSTERSNFRSFSEAGSTITSSFAPLVANLVKQTSERKREEAKFMPQYMKRGESLENTPQHHDFQSNLL